MSVASVVMGEFATGREMLEAARGLRELGHRDLDGYTPYAIEGMDEALALPPSPIPRFVALGGAVGGVFGYLMMYYCNAWDYPINVGGRPLNSYPAFVPITFELTVLFASIVGVISMLALCGLPSLYHPVFRLGAFRSASDDKFWLGVRVRDDAERERVTAAMARAKPVRVAVLEDDA